MNRKGLSFVWDLHGCTKYTALTRLISLKKVQNMWKEKTIKSPDLADMICEQSCRSSSHADPFLQGAQCGNIGHERRVKPIPIFT